MGGSEPLTNTPRPEFMTVIDFDQCLTRSRIADQGVRVSPKLCGPCPCKICEDRRVYVIGVDVLYKAVGVARHFPGVRDALLFFADSSVVLCQPAMSMVSNSQT